MRTLLRFFVQYNNWFLFIFLEAISFWMLFSFNNYQGSVYFSSANSVIGSLHEACSNVVSYLSLRTANERLMERNVSLEQQIAALRRVCLTSHGDSIPADSLRQAIEKECHLMDAEVVVNSIRRADNFITINKGSLDGVKEEMGVVDGRGVVGIVYHTSPHYSLVISVLNSKASISCKISDTNYFGYLKWDGGDCQYANLVDMPRHSICEVGDTIVTTGFTPIFPEGLMVGRVEEISDSHDGLSFLLKIKLSADFGNLNQVKIVDRKNMEELKELQKQIK